MKIWDDLEGRQGRRDGMNYLYGNGILEFVEKGKSFLAMNEGFYEADNGETKGIFRVYTGRGKTKERRLGADSMVRTFSPNLGILNCDKTVVLAKWVAKRQYVRVLNRDTLELNVMYGGIADKLGFSTGTEKGLAYEQLLHPVYPNVQECLAEVLSGGVIASAFNNKYFLANSPYSSNVVRGYKDSEIGEYDEHTGAMKLYDAFADKQVEVSKFFKV